MVPPGVAGFAEYYRTDDNEQALELGQQIVAQLDLSDEEERREQKTELESSRDRIRQNKELLAATRRSRGLALALLNAPSLVDVLLKKPELLKLLDEPDADNVIQAMYNSSELFDTMLRHYPLYRIYLSNKHTRRESTSKVTALQFARNPYYVVLIEEDQALSLELQRAGSHLAMFAQLSASVTEVVLTHGSKALPYLGELLNALRPADLFYNYADREPVVAAAMSSWSLLRFLADDPDLVSVLADIPELAAALRRHRYELAEEEYQGIYRGIFRGGLYRQLKRYPQQVANVFVSPQVVRVAVKVPGVVGAMAAVAELPALLNDSEQVRELIVGQPGVIDALVKVEGLGRALRASPNLVAFLARRPEYITLIRNNPSLLAGIRKNRGILPAIVANPELGKALSLNQALVDWLTLTPKGLQRLRSGSGLVQMLSKVQAQLTVESWQSVLLDTDLLEFLDSHPDFALQFVSDPNIVGFYQQAPGTGPDRKRACPGRGVEGPGPGVAAPGVGGLDQRIRGAPRIAAGHRRRRSGAGASRPCRTVAAHACPARHCQPVDRAARAGTRVRLPGLPGAARPPPGFRQAV